MAIIEKSASDFIDSSDEEEPSDVSKDFSKKTKPFVYKLSDPAMIKMGITVNHHPPVRFVTFHSTPSCRNRFWFETRSEPLEEHYPNGQVSWRHDPSGTAAVKYDNGETAIAFIFGRIGNKHIDEPLYQNMSNTLLMALFFNNSIILWNIPDSFN